MLEILKNPALDSIIELVKNSNKEIVLCAPYVKKTIMKQILENKRIGTKIKLITVSSLPNFIAKSSDIEALEMLLEENIDVYNYTNLHAKTYIFDNTKAVITSGNLTYGGLYKNFEYGIVVSENDLVNQISKDFSDALLEDVCSKISVKNIEDIKELILKIPKVKKVVVVKQEELLLKKECTFEIANSLSGWQKAVFEVITKIEMDEFSLQDDLYLFVKELSNKYPNNNNIEEKIRQQLQILRDKGLIMFVSRGKYRKLWT